MLFVKKVSERREQVKHPGLGPVRFVLFCNPKLIVVELQTFDLPEFISNETLNEVDFPGQYNDRIASMERDGEHS